MKQCLNCNETKSFDLFRKDRHSTDGYYRWCKQCMSDRERAAYSKRDNTKQLSQCKARRDVAYVIMAEHKLNNPCACGESEPVALAFHHKGNKDFGIAESRSLSVERIKEEIAKCIVVCHNCHAKIHAGIMLS